tara:strand:- start:867 stop:1052 length:186 start_codon:yes stop_codon:yes gene_type:complete
MLLYTEEQLHKAYRVYVAKVPAGHEAMDIETFRSDLEQDEETFEILLEEYDRLSEAERNTH